MPESPDAEKIARDAPSQSGIPRTVTADDLRCGRWEFSMHMRLGRGGSVYQYRCVEHPTLTYEKYRPRAGEALQTSFCVGALKADTWQEAANLLNAANAQPAPKEREPNVTEETRPEVAVRPQGRLL